MSYTKAEDISVDPDKLCAKLTARCFVFRECWQKLKEKVVEVYEKERTPGSYAILAQMNRIEEESTVARAGADCER
jgi:hypothetical protein